MNLVSKCRSIKTFYYSINSERILNVRKNKFKRFENLPTPYINTVWKLRGPTNILYRITTKRGKKIENNENDCGFLYVFFLSII